MGKAKDKLKAKKFRITNVKSLVFIMIVVISVFITAASMVTVYIEFGSDINMIFEEYMSDMASSGGEIVQTLYKEFNDEVPAEKWNEYFSEMCIENLPSSYAYIVDTRNSVMIYHPTEAKIGQPVTNNVILNLCDNIKSGNVFESKKFVEYVFNGSEKIAAYSVVADNNYVLVISADKSDITADILRIMLMTLVITTVIMLIALVIVIIINNKVMKDLDEVTGVVQQLGRFDLSVDEAQTKRLCAKQSEIGDIAVAVRDLRDSLINTVASLKNNSETLDNCAVELSSNSKCVSDSVENIDIACTEIAEGATNQAQSTEQATAAAVRMGGLIDQSIQAVGSLKSASEVVKSATYSAGEKLSNVSRANDSVIEVTDLIKKSIMETSQSAESIKEAANIITDIASQTSLLALNASIEAARAGESGRGFAVVASEISQLADRSNEAAEEIQVIIETLISNSNKSVEDIQEANRITGEQTESLSEAVAEFDKARNGLDRSIEEIDKVKQSTEGLDESKNQVIDIIQSLAAISEENAASTEETAASVTQAKAMVENVEAHANKVSDVAKTLAEDASKWSL